MDILAEAATVRRTWVSLASSPEWSLLVRHDLLADKPPASLLDRIHRRLRTCLAAIGVLPPRPTPFPWTSALKHAPVDAGVVPVVIWALGVDPAVLRQACHGLARRLQGNSAVAPVLVTDIADFAMYSRLGWLVEYLPELTGTGPSYRERKQRHLAWRYRGAVVLPVAAGLADDAAWQQVLRMLPR